jgi:hypothetical protein
MCLLVFSLIGCTGTLQRNISNVSNPCKSRSIETIQNGTGDPSKLKIFAVTDASSDSREEKFRYPESNYPESPAPCNDGQTDSGKNEDSGEFVANIKAGLAAAKKSFCPTPSEISESYLALVRSQQDFCKSSNVENKEKQKPFNNDRDIFRGLDGVLLKIVPFYIFNH